LAAGASTGDGDDEGSGTLPRSTAGGAACALFLLETAGGEGLAEGSARSRAARGRSAGARARDERTATMSWSFQAVGKPSAVYRAIEESVNNQLTGQSLI